MGCGNSLGGDEGIESHLDTGVSFLKKGTVMKAKEHFTAALELRPKLSLRVGQAGGRLGGMMNFNSMSQQPQPGSPGSTLIPGAPSFGDSSSNNVGLSGSAVFDKISTQRLHEALETLRLRNRIASIYFEFSQLVFAEEQYMAAQQGALSCRHSSTNPEQRCLSNQIWVNSTLGVANVALVDARQTEHHSASTHDRLCGYVLAQCSSLKHIVSQEEGNFSGDMAQVLHLEAQAHAERKNYRQALFCAQKAAGISTRFGVHSDEREKALIQVSRLKEKLLQKSSSSVVSEESLEDVSS